METLDTEEEFEGGPRGLTRRDLIKRGAIVGGIVWAAPAIDSFVSAAAAGSPPGAFPCSYAVIIYTTAGSAGGATASNTFAVKLNDPSPGCDSNNTDGCFGPNNSSVFTCGGLTYGVNANNGWEISGGFTLNPIPDGNCAFFTVNGSVVSVSSAGTNAGVVILTAILKDGSLFNNTTCRSSATGAGWTIVACQTGQSGGAFKCTPGSSFTVPTGCCGT